MRPYHAGLLGADSLVVLDEAHLVPPFERLVESIASGRDAGGRSLRPEPGLDVFVPPLRMLSLSATGRVREDVLGLDDDDREHPVVLRRLDAKKRSMLRDEVKPAELAESLAAEAWTLAEDGAAAVRCLVYCNRRDDAVKVQATLENLRKRSGVEAIETELLVGGRRVYEREQAARWLRERGFFAGSAGQPRCATFVVATSAGEVGVDLDADHMVADLVAWERMVQRFGRVNRRGEGDASVVVVPALAEEDDDKARLAAVRALLDELPSTKSGKVDVSPGALAALRERSRRKPALAALFSNASTPPALHPPLTRATVESWSMTSLEEHTGRPEVAPWIRGWVEEPPQTTIAWRADLPLRADGNLLGAEGVELFREAADPHLSERLETETWRTVAWLHERLQSVSSSAPDVADSEASARPLRPGDVAAVVLGGPRGSRTLRAGDFVTKEELAGALLLVDVRLGGLSAGLLDDDSNDASDVSLVDGADRVVPFRVRRVTEEDAAAPVGWRTEARIAVRVDDEEETEWLVVESPAGEGAASQDGRAVAVRRAQLLADHVSWAEQEAAEIAAKLELSEPHQRVLRAAARLHDVGKQAITWQRAFRAPGDGVYAKTTTRPNLKVLGKYRHEFGSLAHAARSDLLERMEPSLRDLCLHVIAAHHGRARPTIEIEGAEEPPTQAERRAREVALRFARLERRWGLWGLAWWEALLRAADQRASKRIEAEGGSRG
jgi:CRISPR-associated endonuclease/helicase Cas3